MSEEREQATAAESARGPWHPATTWAPLVGVALVLLVTLAFGRLIGFTRGAIEGEPAPIAAPAEAAEAAPTGLALEAHELHARVGWCLSAIVLTLALCAALLVALHVAREALGPRGRMLLAAGALVCVAAGVVVWQRQTVMLPPVLQQRVDAIALGVKSVRELSKGAAVAVILGLLLAMCAVLRPSARTAAALAAQTRRLRVLLFVSAGLLVAGVLEIAFLLRWPLARVAPAEAKALGELAQSVTTAAGGVLAMFLVAAYGLASAILMARARELAPATGEPERRNWLAEHGLDSSLSQHMSRALVMISPWVASGPLSTLLESFT